jgi:Kef-type K+ transport system membrane component KefB
MQTAWGAWDASYVWSAALIALTIAIHVIGVVAIARAIGRFWGGDLKRRLTFFDTTVGVTGVIVAVALSLAVLHAIESGMWAAVYVRIGALPTPGDALLYSVDSMTTRGSSGLHMVRQWRIMGAIEAGNGMLLYGISTAFLFAVMRRLWERDARGT